MRNLSRCVVAIGLAVVCACKANDGGQAANGSGSAAMPTPPPVTCPAGSVIGAGNACVAVVTPDKVAAVATQQTRIDDLAKLLDQIDVVSAPVELLNGIRQLPEWKSLAAKSTKLQILDTVVGTLDQAVKELRTFKGSLAEASLRLGNLKGELGKLMTDTGATKRLADVRTQISAQVRGIVDPLAAQTQDAITKALTPLQTQLADTADFVIGACAMAKLSGGGDNLKQLCVQAKDVFAKATTFVDDMKGRPAKLYDDLVVNLAGQLDQLIDTETKQLMTTAQTRVDAALRLPPADASGSAVGSGSGSATP